MFRIFFTKYILSVKCQGAGQLSKVNSFKCKAIFGSFKQKEEGTIFVKKGLIKKLMSFESSSLWCQRKIVHLLY